MEEDVIENLFQAVTRSEGYRLNIDLETQSISAPSGPVIKFEVEPFRKHCLLNGLDDIGLTLQHAQEIRQYEQKQAQITPWMFAAKLNQKSA